MFSPVTNVAFCKYRIASTRAVRREIGVTFIRHSDDRAGFGDREICPSHARICFGVSFRAGRRCDELVADVMGTAPGRDNDVFETREITNA